MGRPLKATGRKVREYSSDAIAAQRLAKRALYKVLASYEPDPVILLRAIGEAWKHIDIAEAITNDIHTICVLEAQRSDNGDS